MRGEQVGTLVLAQGKSISPRKRWIGFSAQSCGRIVVDAGARTAIVRAGAEPAGGRHRRYRGGIPQRRSDHACPISRGARSPAGCPTTTPRTCSGSRACGPIASPRCSATDLTTKSSIATTWRSSDGKWAQLPRFRSAWAGLRRGTLNLRLRWCIIGWSCCGSRNGVPSLRLPARSPYESQSGGMADAAGFKIQFPLREWGFKSPLWYLRLIVATRCGTSHKLRPARSLLRFLPRPPLPLCRRLQCRSMQINADRCELYGTIVGTSCHHCWHRLTRRFAQRGTPRHCMHGHVPTRPAPDARSFWSLQSLRRTCLAAERRPTI